MTNQIKVTKCDNELIILAYQWGASFELCRILSGNSNSVDVTMQINKGAYQGPTVLNGVHHPLHPQTIHQNLESGKYSLLLLGIDWGGPAEFAVKVNDTHYGFPYQSEGDGLVWHSDPICISVN